MQYRGYDIEPLTESEQPIYTISDEHGYIDCASSHLEAEHIIDGWQMAR